MFFLHLDNSLVYTLLRIINVRIFVVCWIYLVTIKSSIFSILVITHLNQILLGPDVLLADVPVRLLWFIWRFRIRLIPTFARVWSAIGSWIEAFWGILNAFAFLIVSCWLILSTWVLFIKEVMTRISLCSNHELLNSRWLWFIRPARLRQTPTSLFTILLD